MGASKKLHTKLSKMAAPLTLPTGPQRGRADMPNLEKLIEQGFDPVHAVYVFVQNISSFFAEGVSHLPEMKTFAKIYTKAEDAHGSGMGICVPCRSEDAVSLWRNDFHGPSQLQRQHLWRRQERQVSSENDAGR